LAQLVSLLTLISTVTARIHNISIDSDRREIIPLSSFGLLKEGFINLDVSKLHANDWKYAEYGVVLENSKTVSASQYIENHINVCNPAAMATYDKHPNLLKLKLKISEPPAVQVVEMPDVISNFDTLQIRDLLHDPTKADFDESKAFSLVQDKETDDWKFSLQFTVKEVKDEGQYTVYFYRCGTSGAAIRPDYEFEASIVQKNGNSYLSAGEKPMTLLFLFLGGVYFCMGWIWVKVMVHYSDNLFKIHFLMGALVWAKFLASVLHSVDYYFIATYGKPEEAWAILWYIIHLVRGLLLFISLALIGMGFAFVKHVLSSNEKMVLMTVVPLQIIANVAYVIIDSSEEAALNYGTWKKVLIFVDLLCCGAIIFPVMWSIRHLQQATEVSDNKTTLILSQLKLFRQFYVLVVVYIYITRIALQFLLVILPFQYTWCGTLFDECATVLFFTLTGWKFRPYVQNPYYKLADEDEEELEMESMIPSSATDTLQKRNISKDVDEV